MLDAGVAGNCNTTQSRVLKEAAINLSMNLRALKMRQNIKVSLHMSRPPRDLKEAAIDLSTVRRGKDMEP